MFTGRIVTGKHNAVPSRDDKVVFVHTKGQRIQVTVCAHQNDQGQDSFRIDVDHKGYLTPIGDVTDHGDGQWVFNLYDQQVGVRLNHIE